MTGESEKSSDQWGKGTPSPKKKEYCAVELSQLTY
jgi:hypothetical protein